LPAGNPKIATAIPHAARSGLRLFNTATSYENPARGLARFEFSEFVQIPAAI
jgi:hypothetical protein